VLRENVDNRGSVWSETRGSVCAETKGSLCSEMEGSIWAEYPDTQLNYRLGKEEYKSTTINVYPNPSTGNFQFQYVLTEGEIATIEVYDMLGKIVYNKSLTATNSTHSITLKNCDNGLYNLRLTSSNGSVYSNLLSLIK